MMPTNGRAISITAAFVVSKVPSAINLNISVSPKKISLTSPITKAIIKKDTQM
jgi:hypothetical protein